MREALECDNEQIADKCYTECGTTRSGCCGGRWRLTGSRGGASAHAPSTPENLVTNFSYEDLTSASSGCEALWKHTISNTTVSLFRMKFTYIDFFQGDINPHLGNRYLRILSKSIICLWLHNCLYSQKSWVNLYILKLKQ